eukprot:81976-Pleurochrysis_carterae.AAC.1
MLTSDADVSRNPPARRAFTVATGPVANTPPAPLSSSVFPLPPSSPSQTACLRLHEGFQPSRCPFPPLLRFVK